jgi:hypothetical protein
MKLAVTVLCAAVVAVAWSFLPSDIERAQYWKDWVPKKYRRFQLQTIAMHLVALATIVVTSSALGWTPSDDDGTPRLVGIAAAWGSTAALLLRAEVNGLRSNESLPIGTLLRALLSKSTAAMELASAKAIGDWVGTLSTDEALRYATWCVVVHYGFDPESSVSSALLRDQAFANLRALEREGGERLHACAQVYASTWGLWRPNNPIQAADATDRDPA